MRIRTMLTALMAICGAGVFLAAVPANAFDSAGFQTIYRNYAGSVGSPAGGFATCPTGTKAVSAGGSNAVLSDLTLSLDGLSAYSIGTPIGAGAPYTVVQATCAPAGQVSHATLIHVAIPAAPGNIFRANFTCPAGTSAFGGGGYFTASNGTLSPGARLYADAPTPDGRGWLFRAKGLSGSQIVHATVRCVPPPPPPLGHFYSVVTVSKNVANSAGSTTGSAVCPAGTKPVSGGAWWTKSSGAIDELAALTSSESIHGPDAWQGAGNGHTGDTLHVIARCANTMTVVVIGHL
jgi:hypothetical protein